MMKTITRATTVATVLGLVISCSAVLSADGVTRAAAAPLCGPGHRQSRRTHRGDCVVLPEDQDHQHWWHLSHWRVANHHANWSSEEVGCGGTSETHGVAIECVHLEEGPIGLHGSRLLVDFAGDRRKKCVA
jgi:hypothetical protein